MTDSRQERIQRLVEGARHDSVTADLLDGDIVTPKGTNLVNQEGSGVETERLAAYLTDEQPHFIFMSRRDPPTIYGPEAPSPPESPKLNKVVHIVTDRRWLMLGGHDGDEQRLSLPLSEFEVTNYDSTVGQQAAGESDPENRIVLRTAGAYFDVPVSDHYDQEDFVDLCLYLREAAGARPRSAALDPDAAEFEAEGRDGAAETEAEVAPPSTD